MDTKEYRMEIKVKNNLLYKKIYDNYGSIINFSKATGISTYMIMGFLNFKYALYNKRDGELKNSVKKLMDIFKCPLNELFPENYKVIETNRHIKEISQQEIEMISMQNPEINMLTYSIDSEVEQSELRDRIEKVLGTIRAREAEVIRLRYLDGYTLEEVGKRLGTSKARVGQIAKKALRKMMHPSRAKLLKGYVEGRNIMTSINAYDSKRLENLIAEDKMILCNLIEDIFVKILDIEHKFYKIDNQYSVKFKFGKTYYNSWTDDRLETETLYVNKSINRSYQLGGDFWRFPIEVDYETIDKEFVKKYEGKCVKIIYSKCIHIYDKQVKYLFKQLIDIFVDLCKQTCKAEIADNYIILPRIEFRKLEDKVNELTNIMNADII